MHPLFSSAITLIDDPTPRPGAMNMALDEVLLGGLMEMPVLRCYLWLQHEISFGCFGHTTRVEEEYPGVRRVRRWTGGGMVEHGADFTFTVFVPRSLPLALLAASESYRCIHQALSAALQNVGMDDLEPATAGRAQPAAMPPTDAPFLKPCFTHPVEHDLLSGGEKIAGGAQRRTRRGLMHQGSVQSSRGSGGFSDSLRADLSRHLAAALATGTEPRPVTNQELALAEELAAKKYDAPSWTNRF